jgi:hypothetical protein
MVLMAFLLAACTIFYFHTTIGIVRWNDPAAYVYAGRQLAATGAPVYVDENNALVGPYFTLHGFLVQRSQGDPNFYANYAVGLPLLIALADRVLGPAVPAHLVVVPSLAALGMIFVFALGRLLFGRWVGLLSAGLLALSVDYWTYATETWSDVPATALILGGMFFTIWAVRRNSGLGGAAGGFLLGYACLIRYPSALSFLPLGAYLVLTLRRQPLPRRALVALAAVLAAFLGAILLYNTAMFGGPLETSYDPRFGWVPWPAFSWQNFAGNSPVASGGLLLVLEALWTNAHLWLIVAIGGLLVMPRAEAVLVGGNLALTILVYAAYLWPSRDARLVMFALPMIFLAAAYAVVWLLRHRLPQGDWRYGPIIAGILLIWYLPQANQTGQALLARNRSARNVAARVESIAAGVEPNAVFLSRRYHDLLILYGQRSALHYALLAPPDPDSGSYQVEGYEGRLVEVVGQLLAQDKPVYVIPEAEGLQLREGLIEPFPILSTHFTLTLQVADPPVYRVEPTGNPGGALESSSIERMAVIW